MTGILYESGLGAFLLVTVALGGGAAWLAGRAIAQTWRRVWWVPLYMLLIGASARFFHYALFDGTLLTLHYFLIDTTVALALGLLGFRRARAIQMTTQYAFLFRRSGALGWVRRGAQTGTSDRMSDDNR